MAEGWTCFTLLQRVLTCLAVWLACATNALADTSEVVEYQVKAAFLYKFGTYVDWPAQAFALPDSPVIIGVMGADAVADEVAQISSGRTIKGRPVSVKKIGRGGPVNAVHVLFIARLNGAALADALATTKGQPILVVTEAEAQASSGVINFVVTGDKVRFDIDLPSAELNNLKLSARLLSVARKVIGGPL